MTSRQYARIEKLLEQAETVTDEHPLLTIQGSRIKAELHELLQNVATERIRTEIEEGIVTVATPASDSRTKLLHRIREYERIIASFDAMNANLRHRRRGATDSAMAYWDWHIELNERIVQTMQAGLKMVRKQLALGQGESAGTD